MSGTRIDGGDNDKWNKSSISPQNSDQTNSDSKIKESKKVNQDLSNAVSKGQVRQPKEGDGWLAGKAREYGLEHTADFLRDDWTGEMVRKTGLDDVADFLTDKDKVCTDGKDDGKLSLKEGAKAFGKGLVFGIPKAMANHPVATAATIGGCALLIIATGGAAAIPLAAVGIAGGVGMAGYGTYKYAKAETDGEAKMALETAGIGVTTTGLSAASAGSALKAGAKAGVKSADIPEDANIATKVVQTFKSTPEAVKQSVSNVKGNYLSHKTGIIYANSDATREGVEVGFQTGKKVNDAYKVDLTGNVDEVLAKNPGISYDAEAGKYYVQTSWGEKSYIQNQNYMVVEYAPGDVNAVEGAEFFDTYIDHAKFEATGAKKYINPSELKPGQHVETSKNAPARFKIVEPGTEYMSAEGKATVQKGSVLRIDGQGRPYQSTVEYMLNKVDLTDSQIAELYEFAPDQVVKTTKGLNYLAKADFAVKLAEYKGADGKQFLSSREISNLLENEAGLGGKPIENFQAKIVAVLSNPEEVAEISSWENRAAGVWRAIQDPLSSTEQANPKLFGIEPKAVTRQYVPSQQLSNVVVDQIYGGKAEAEAIVFGNGTLADIEPQILQNATKELTNYFGRTIKPTDLQVVRTSKGAFISYFDTETNLATTFSSSGKLNGQTRIIFDAQGNIQSHGLEKIYADGKFWSYK